MKKEIAWKGLLPTLCLALVFALLALRGSAQGRLQRVCDAANGHCAGGHGRGILLFA